MQISPLKLALGETSKVAISHLTGQSWLRSQVKPSPPFQIEVGSVPQIALQNHIVLDIVTANHGRVCYMINQSCSYINWPGEIGLSLHKVQ